MEADPSITLGPLKMWIAGYQYADAETYSDANWLAATARCEGHGSRVEVGGAFIHLDELKRWREDLEAFRESLVGVVELPTIEPELAVKIEGKKEKRGHLSCEVRLTGEHMTERHQYSFEIDQSYLPGLLAQLAAVFRALPIRYEKKG